MATILDMYIVHELSYALGKISEASSVVELSGSIKNETDSVHIRLFCGLFITILGSNVWNIC